MSKRQRKKWLKQHGKYINPKDTWSLDYTIAEFVLPRLKLFKEKTLGYPGTGEANTPEKWDAILDKIILSFELILDDDDWWMGDPEYDVSKYLEWGECGHIIRKNGYDEVNNRCQEERKRREQVIQEGLDLFAKWFRSLWW